MVGVAGVFLVRFGLGPLSYAAGTPGSENAREKQSNGSMEFMIGTNRFKSEHQL